jgi:DNA mismatch repair ATPase MutS
MFPSAAKERPLETTEPESFKDLYLDQLINWVSFNKKVYGLPDFYRSPIDDPEIIEYRQAIARDLESVEVQQIFNHFSETLFNVEMTMSGIRGQLAYDDKFGIDYLMRGRVIDCAEWYCHEINTLAVQLANRSFQSEGLRAFAEYIKTYVASPEFQEVSAHSTRLRQKLLEVDFCLLVRYKSVSVVEYDGQKDYAKLLTESFSRFNQGENSTYKRVLPERASSDKVENAILGMVARIYKETFDDLAVFCKKYSDFFDRAIIRFSREVQFYISWHETIKELKDAGLPFCYPKVTHSLDRVYGYDVFNMVIARDEASKIVLNDYELNVPERIIVITGPNQGGKTTFARAFAQTHYIGSLGLPVPGREAELFLFDKILTHFGREEDIETQNGQLRDDLLRLRNLLDQATPRSLIIVNEVFASTTLSDAIVLGEHMMDKLVKLGAPVICVTFIDEMAQHGAETVSMVGVVNQEDPGARTYKIVRRPPDGRAYAESIAGKYKLTYAQLSGRLKK